MQKHEQKTCPRCQSVFECKTGNIEQCQCQTVSLDEAQLDYIHARYDDCLAVVRRECNLQAHERLIHALLSR